MKLFMIGDSFCGSYASASTAAKNASIGLALAKAMNISHYEEISGYYCGLPVSLDYLMDSLGDYTGYANRIKTQTHISDYANSIYENRRKTELNGKASKGKNPNPGDGHFWHNLSICGATIADAWLLNSSICNTMKEEENLCPDTGIPVNGFYKAASMILNPSGQKRYNDFSAIDWLEYHHTNKDDASGVENLVLWLGIGNVINTLFDMDITQSPGRTSKRPLLMKTNERRAASWNLSHPVDFEHEYSELISRIDAVMAKKRGNWSVYLLNIPHVTIFPFLKGVGPTFTIPKNGQEKTYFKYYTYFPYEYECAYLSDNKMGLKDILYIDHCIDAYNNSIQKLIDKANKKHKAQRYHIVDVNGLFDKIATKRNGYKPDFSLQNFYPSICPPPDTRLYFASESGRIKQGGIFSLDGIHFSAYGKALVAQAILEKMQSSGRHKPADLQYNWESFIGSDRLFSNPPKKICRLFEDPAIGEKFLNMIIQAFPG